MITKNTEIAIIGGGIIGMLTARELAIAGLQVCILEKNNIAQESTWAGGGILTPLYPWRYPQAVNVLAFRSMELYPTLVQSLQTTSGIDPEYLESGLLMNGNDVDDQGRQWLEKNQQVFETVDASEIGLKITGDIPSYLFFPKICQVRNPRFAQALEETIAKIGVELKTHCAVKNLSQSDGGIVVTTDSERILAQKAIICAGAWSGELMSNLGHAVPIKPVRGQMLLFKTPPGILRSIILSQGKYIIPRKDGHILVGSTMEDVGFDKSTTEQAKYDLIEFVRQTLPELARYPVAKHWSGLRPASPEGTPYICAYPNLENVFVNSGHFRNGVILGPASAELMAEIVLDRQSALEQKPYHLP